MKNLHYTASNPNIKPIKAPQKRRIDKRKLFFILLGVAFSVGVITEIIDALTESKEERFEKWLRKTAQILPNYNWQNYKDFTVFPQSDFFLRYAGKQWLIHAGDTTAYLERAADVRRYIEGSKIDIIALEIDVNPNKNGIDASAKIWVKWQPKQGGDLPVAYSNLAAEVEAIETKNGWKATSVRVFSVGEMVNFMGKHVIEFINRTRKK